MLSKLSRLKESREQGFTLIELLVVILIIGILAAIAIPMFMNQRKAAVDSSVQSDVTNAAKQVETWIVKQGATSANIPGGPVTVTTASNPFSAAGNNALPGIDSLRGIKVSDGTQLVIAGNSFAYTITGTNSGGDKSVAKAGTPPHPGILYDSANGGLQR